MTSAAFVGASDLMLHRGGAVETTTGELAVHCQLKPLGASKDQSIGTLTGYCGVCLSIGVARP